MSMLIFRYTHSNGQTLRRFVEPVILWYGTLNGHKGEQWFLKATDLGGEVISDFAVNDIEDITLEQLQQHLK